MTEEEKMLEKLLKRRWDQMKEEEKKDTVLTETVDIPTFEDRIRNNLISDRMVTAQLMIGGAVNTNYNIYIDRKTITRNDGAVITFRGILNMFGMENLSIFLTYKPEEFGLSED